MYEPRYESAAAYWPFVHRNIIVALLINQIALIGLFSVKQAVASTPFLLPLPCFTIIFHLYCCQKFLPAFKNYPLEVTSPTFIPSIFRIVCRSRLEVSQFHKKSMQCFDLVNGRAMMFVDVSLFEIELHIF